MFVIHFNNSGPEKHKFINMFSELNNQCHFIKMIKQCCKIGCLFVQDAWFEIVSPIVCVVVR